MLGTCIASLSHPNKKVLLNRIHNDIAEIFIKNLQIVTYIQIHLTAFIMRAEIFITNLQIATHANILTRDSYRCVCNTAYWYDDLMFFLDSQPTHETLQYGYFNPIQKCAVRNFCCNTHDHIYISTN